MVKGSLGHLKVAGWWVGEGRTPGQERWEGQASYGPPPCVYLCVGDEQFCPLRKSGAHEEAGLCPLILPEP